MFTEVVKFYHFFQLSLYQKGWSLNPAPNVKELLKKSASATPASIDEFFEGSFGFWGTIQHIKNVSDFGTPPIILI